jgi:LysR family glycine cleavage system transcriptional activator
MPEKRNIPPLTWLRAFEATARHMSFLKASEELGVTPSALSHQVRQLEDRLGVKLFERLNRAIRLTDTGQRVFPALRDGFDRLADAMDRVRPPSPDDLLVVTSGPAFAAKWLAPRLYRFVDENPDLEIRIAASLRLQDFVIDGIDVGIRFGAGNYPGLITERVVDESVLPLCSPSLAREAKLEGPKDLAHVPLLHDDSIIDLPQSIGWRDWLNAAGAYTISANRGLHFSHADHGLDAAIEGAGVVLGRRSLAEGDLRTGRLVAPFDLEIPLRELAFWLVYPPDQAERPKVKAFRDWLFAEIERDQGATKATSTAKS